MPTVRILTLLLFVVAPALPSAAHDRSQHPLPPTTARSNPHDAQPRSSIEINRDVRAAMRQEAAANTQQERARAIQRLVELYREIMAHPDWQANPAALSRSTATVWRRLTRVKAQLERELAQLERQADRTSFANQPSSREFQSLASGPNDAPRGQGGLAQNDAQALIELIEATISPDFWEARGGPGRIRYYPPGHGLVVSATSQVHRDVGRVIQQLRAARQ